MTKTVFKFAFLALIGAVTLLPATANDLPDGNDDRALVDLSTVRHPNPHMMLDDEPQAWYETTTGALVFYFDTTCYNQYTITLSSDYASLDYYVTTPVVTFPASMLAEVTEIYIDSDDCGAYEGVLVVSDYMSTVNRGFKVEKGATFSVRQSVF